MSVQYEAVRLSRVAIIGLEINVDLIAQYNPKEVQIEKSANWTPHATHKTDVPDLEFTTSGARTLSMELFFDTYEDGGDVSKLYVAKLIQLISVMDPDGDEMHKRPTVVRVVWPDRSNAVFEGVLQSVTTKYTMFSPTGTPLRATCAVKILEARRQFDRDPPTRRAPPRRVTGW